ncbi:hypothetical protein DNHGIG_28500 [Collibacillus ludicampi]|uniref:ATP-binding protein n=1 Tax=Collibacillus ludicampi TaxID=2771369 RepID=A0AAV4LHH7_9BACL|nr:hypothetical protein [Collibacillus ludicampi]GIM47301.1 hypothetical protein DNHGIG_28500 [Collibacillus ludicampi]
MKINSREMELLLEEIEKIRRRKIMDMDESDIHYIDPRNHLAKIKIHNNNIISGRRGCGKTTLLLAAKKELNSSDLCIAIDCQSIRKQDQNNIIIYILNKILEAAHQYIESECYEPLLIRKRFTFGKKKNDEEQRKINRCELFLHTVREMLSILDEIKNHPNEITYKVNYKQSNSNKSESKKETGSKLESKNQLEGHLDFKYQKIGIKLNSINSILLNVSNSSSKLLTDEEKTEVTSEDIRTIKKDLILNDIVDNLSQLFTEYREISNKNITLFLDDFYQIPIEKHPRIIHFLHDVYKNCKGSAFSFKICTLPNRLKLNYEGDEILSPKDDFSTINLDRNLSELDSLKQYLLEIICSIKQELHLQTREIEQLFSSDETLLYLIVASGGVPRDFLLMFRDVIEIAKINSKETVGKVEIYSVVNEFRKDKDENIEVDTDITPELIEEAKSKIKSEIVDKLNTNVFLYPHSLLEHDEALLRNLVNSRYLHIIKDSVSSENRKKEMFTAYLVDMSFYINGKQLKRNFKFREFWKKDNESRFKDIDSAPIWAFSKSSSSNT